MSYIRYKPPREVLGEYLATNFRDLRWDTHYNEDQKEFWYKEADKLLAKMKDWEFM